MENINNTVLECKTDEVIMKELMGLDIERSIILHAYDDYRKAVEEHGYYSEEALTRKLFMDLHKIGIAQEVLENFGFNLPKGYVFKDENGNEILTSEIILEKKKKELL
jgi:virulence-associated protein VapD